jgi:2-keto-4-pentenoate hydratase/2-oxohepta-3-ene-1,7-dioic acid hydratase in catechol pathway
MPGIPNKYFRIAARAFSVSGMTSAPAAGYALGVFRRPAAAPGDVFTGLVRHDLGPGGRVRDVSGFGPVSDLLRHWDDAQDRLDELAAAPGSGDWLDLDTLDVRCPVDPGQILQCGANYRKHVVDIVMAERRADLSVTGHNSGVPEDEVRAWAEAMMDERARAGRPYVFAGLSGALAGPYDEIVLPDRGDKHDWELELAAVIGRPARNVSRETALDYVAGYTICNDITTRSLVYRHDLKAIGSDWFAAKNAPTFLPTGPFLVPARFAGDPANLRITLRHNGIVRQDESTADMLFDLPAILAYITEVTELRPGDLVLTGSPAGNGAHWGVFLRGGDLLEGEITGLGTQRNPCVGQHGVSKHGVSQHGVSQHGVKPRDPGQPGEHSQPDPGQPAAPAQERFSRQP